VTVWAKAGSIMGVIARKPKHLLTNEEMKKVPEIHELWIDVGAAEHPEIDPAVDAEYARKYRGSTSAIAHINSPEARATTMRVDPR